MVIKKYHFAYLLLTLFLFSCAGGGKKERGEIRSFIQTSEFDKALELVDKSKVYKDKDNALLLLMEKGLILHRAGRYYQSSEFLMQAKELGRKLYTTSISNKVQKLIANDNYDIYYGERYEISLIHFYQALNHLLIAKQGFFEAYKKVNEKGEIQVIPERKLTTTEVKQRLMSARSEVLAWDSFLNNLKSERMGQSVFKNDLLAKIFGAYIHELIGTRTDLQVSLQLYKDSYDLIIKNYSAYRSFNKSFKEYNKNYKTFSKLGIKAVEEKFIEETSFQKDLKNYLAQRIVDLTLKIRPAGIKELKRKYKISNKIIKEARANRNPNTTIVFQKGIIPLKVAKKEYFGLGAALRDPKAGAGAKIGAAVLTVFAANELGLLPPPNTYSPGGVYLGLNVAQAAVAGAAISFELPKIDNPGITSTGEVIVKNEKGETVLKKPLYLIAPLGDIAEQAIAEEASSLYARVGSRLAIKHISAIVAAFATYSALGSNKNNSFFARQAAVIQYLATAKGIEASERADTRYWSTLPSDIWIGRFNLAVGNYQVYVRFDQGAQEKLIKLGPLEVKDSSTDNFINFKALP